MASKEYITLDLSEIHPYPNNPRINDDAVNDVIASIEQCEYIDPIEIDEDNIILSGHTRYKALNKLKYKECDVIRVKGLTDDEKRKYRLLANKTGERALWDSEKLEIELDGLDFGGYDFNFDLNFDMDISEEEHQKNKEDTREKVLDIVNLGKGQFAGTGIYDIPILEPVTNLPPISEWIGFNYVLTDDNPQGKAVHFFIDDYQFERIWNNPEKYVDKLRQYVCVATPDFSPYGDMPHALQIYNHYRKHWVGAWLQSHGVTVIPTIRCSTDRRSLDWYLDGEPQGGAVIISSMWTSDKSIEDISRLEYTTMRDRLKPNKIFVYGKNTGNMGIEDNDPVEYVKSFSERRWS